MHISERDIARFVAVCSVLTAAILLVGAIVALTYISSKHSRIITTASFTLLFAGSVSLFTSSGRAEIFAATAAYAAVLVVFMSGNNASDCG